MHVAVFLFAFSTGALADSILRSKRQYLATVPLYGACNEYVSCAAPATCQLGTCQCIQPYATVGSACALASIAAQAVDQQVYQYPGNYYPRPAAPAPAHPAPAPAAHVAYPAGSPLYRQMYDSVPVAPAPATRLAVAPVARPSPVVYYPQAVVPPTRIAAYDGTYIRESCLPPCAAPAPIVPPPVHAETVPPTPTTQIPTTTPGKFFDGPSIGYPGDYCEIPRTVCVGGSICVQNVCSCRKGEEVVAGQCVRVEVTVPSETSTASQITPTTTAFETASTTTTAIPTTSTTTTTTTTTEYTTTTTPTTTTTTPTTTTTTIAPTTTLLTTLPSTTTQTTTTMAPIYTETTTTPSTTTTTQPLITSTYVLANPQEPITPGTSNPCTQCSCNPGFVKTLNGCVPGQVIRINLVANMAPGSSCLNSSQCTRGAFCGGQGQCTCARRFMAMGTKCVLRR